MGPRIWQQSLLSQGSQILVIAWGFGSSYNHAVRSISFTSSRKLSSMLVTSALSFSVIFSGSSRASGAVSSSASSPQALCLPTLWQNNLRVVAPGVASI
mmetsp:Transcript_53377/g.106118  ORF Transcript_53377/g.106118 Transcript_53377/m.106118 type:complete len:99 (+) Transcript_53377:215-511(+)|eukprot:CAMPEP_0174714394 /NCGR_PEP_ID=MMETSP1094-20130205/17597_1 /TAXON_ID=156173 /ORGANISM="Chrysochromulina brevifilum, Strain UTEX LB 985" /LENGTH=98 /DNA_ID=CAMNT_0015913737 /DNA_START=170 /DNA_END=466 /DNA_ORIENTATION=-